MTLQLRKLSHEQTQNKFLGFVREGADINTAANECGLTRGRFYQMRQTDESFCQRWEDAKHESLENVREEFLDLIAETGNSTEAAQRVGASRRALYNWRQVDPMFRSQWDAALYEHTDAVRSLLLAELMKGHTEITVFQRAVQRDGETVWEDYKRVITTKTKPLEKLRYLQLYHPEFSGK